MATIPVCDKCRASLENEASVRIARTLILANGQTKPLGESELCVSCGSDDYDAWSERKRKLRAPSKVPAST